MSDDEGEDIEISLEDKTETFSEKEANCAETVRERFDLDQKPACVYTKKKKTPVKFGELEGGKTYKIEKVEKIPKQKAHLQNALALSLATYKEDPTEYLSDSSTYHSIEKVCAVSTNSPQKVVLAVGVVDSKKVLYVGYRGSTFSKIKSSG